MGSDRQMNQRAAPAIPTGEERFRVARRLSRRRVRHARFERRADGHLTDRQRVLSSGTTKEVTMAVTTAERMNSIQGGAYA